MSVQFPRRYPEIIRQIINAEELDGHPESIFAIDPDGRLIYVNEGWYRFADDNSGQPQIADSWGIGSSYFAAIPEPLEPFYRKLFRQAPGYGEAVTPLAHTYQCSAPTVYREFSMLIYTLPEQRGHLVVNSLVVERPHDPQEQPPKDPGGAHYIDDGGFIHQCAHCRRIEHQGGEARWDWVPAWVERMPPNTSHGICPVCRHYYFPRDSHDSARR